MRLAGRISFKETFPEESAAAKMKKLFKRLRGNHVPSESGINMVDLMMWLVIAALLLAAAIQGIGYYQKTAYIHNMKTELDGVAANAHAAASMNGGSMDDATLASVVTDNNAKHNSDSITISYGTMLATAAGPVDGDPSGMDRMSAVAAVAGQNAYYLKATSTLVDGRYVVYFFEDTATFSKGISDVPKSRIDSGGTDAAIIPGGGSTPSPTATASPSATATAAPTATPTPTPTATVTPPPVVTGPSITSASDIVAYDANGELWNYRSGSAADGRISIGAAGAAIPDDFFVTDWNGDGFMDLLIKGTDGTLNLRKGSATGGFTNQALATRDWQNFDITVGKFKKTDTYPSIIGKDRTTGILYNYTNPDGSWIGVKNQIGTGFTPFSPFNLIDWDQDGNMDVIARNASNELMLYRTNGAGAFIGETRQTIGAGWTYDSIHVMTGRGGAGRVGLMARGTTAGNLAYYEATKNAWLPAVHVSNGWTGYKIAGN